MDRDTLRAWIQRRLGYQPNLVDVELTAAQLDDALDDALGKFNHRFPIEEERMIEAPSGQSSHVISDAPSGITDVTFFNQSRINIDLYANPFGVVPYRILGGPFAEYGVMLSSVQTFRRVASGMPAWYFDKVANTLYLNCFSRSYYVGYTALKNWTLDTFPEDHVQAFKKMALGHAKVTLGEIRSKFSGRVPAPTGDLQQDGKDQKTEGLAMIKEADEALISIQQDLFPRVD